MTQAIALSRGNTAHTAHTAKRAVTTYHEEKIKGTLYRVTSTYKGDIDLGKALEDLTVRKILTLENNAVGR